MNLQQGTLLQGGKYKILRYINSGGFGCTYEAVHLMLDKKVAIKEFFVKDFCNRDENSVNITVGTTSKVGLVSKLKKKFIDEAVALCKLHHSNIVSVTDVFEENGTAYYVMDYIEGSSLNELIKTRGKLDEQTSLRYIRQVSEALGYVHSQNRLHLDIKPGNIMIDKKDNAILIDFGASKQYDEANGENTSTLMGKTPGYAPLEQMGNEVTQFYPATDIYSLGATLYKALTGITPLSANFLASGEELEPLPDNISENTKKAIYESMNINKKKRPQSIAEFLKLLDGEGVKTQDDDEATEIVGVERPKPAEPKREEPKQELPNEQKHRKKKSKAWIFILLAIIIGGAGYYFVNEKMKGEKKKEAEMLAQAEQERIKKEQEAAQIAQAQKEAEAKRKAEQERLEKERQELEAEKAELEAQKAEQARLEAERKRKEEEARREEERRKKEQSYLTCDELKNAGFRFLRHEESVTITAKNNQRTSYIYRLSSSLLKYGSISDNTSYYGGNVSTDGTLNGVVIINGNGGDNYLAYICEGKIAYPMLEVGYYDGGYYMSLQEANCSYGCIFPSWGAYNDDGLRGSMLEVYQEDFSDQNVLNEIYNATIDTEKLTNSLKRFVRSGKKLSDSWSDDFEYTQMYEGFEYLIDGEGYKPGVFEDVYKPIDERYLSYSQMGEFYCDGVYDTEESRYKNGHGLHTPPLNFNHEHFRIVFSFKALANTSYYQGATRDEQCPLRFDCGELGVCLNEDGSITITTSDANDKDHVYKTGWNYQVNQYMEIDMEYDHGIFIINGHKFNMAMSISDSEFCDHNLHSVDYSVGNAFKGYIKDLRIYSY